jgi:hypothetical protein
VNPLLAFSLGLALYADSESKPAALPNLAAVGFDERCLVPDSIVTRAGSVVRIVEDTLARSLRAEADGDDIAKAACVGDLIRIVKAAPPPERAATLDRVLKARTDLDATTRSVLEQWLRADHLVSEEWDPADGHPRDGLFEPASITTDSNLGIPGARDSFTFVQGAALVFADLATIKRIERDFTRYPERPGTDYESIGLKEGSLRRASVERFGELVAYRCVFTSDLPFPFSSYDCDLAVVDRLDADGRLRCDIQAAGGDFHFMAGCDVYLPVRASDGDLVAWCVARIFSFDLSGVPDGDSDRATALRGSVLNLKRDAEKAQGETAIAVSDAATNALSIGSQSAAK